MAGVKILGFKELDFRFIALIKKNYRNKVLH